MKKFIETFKNIFSIEELRGRILTTLGFLLVFRLGSFIVLPGVDPEKLAGNSGGILGMLDVFLGGAFSQASIFALGIMPYISASIVFQLLTVASPAMQKLQSEGESGRRKINQYTRIATILICLVQSYGYVIGTINKEAIMVDNTLFGFIIPSMIVLVAGTIFCMWIGEKITDKGIGNGISMLIMIGIISRFPTAIYSELNNHPLLVFILELIALFVVVMGVVMLTQAVRRVPVQYAKQVVGSKAYASGERSFIPLKLNSAGVMPIIFAQSVMFIPAMFAQFFGGNSEWATLIGSFSDFRTWQYNVVFAVMIIVFTFFYTAITVDPKKIADDMKRNNSFVPGVKPGLNTLEFIDGVLSRITLPGAILLAFVAILPSIASLLGVSSEFAQFYGGTSLLIMVGVVLDTLQQIESYLLMKHYEGMMKSGKVKGRAQQLEGLGATI